MRQSANVAPHYVSFPRAQVGCLQSRASKSNVLIVILLRASVTCHYPCHGTKRARVWEFREVMGQRNDDLSCSLTLLRQNLEPQICKCSRGGGMRLLVLEYTTSFDIVGISTDHEVEVLPTDRIFERRTR